jgi:hypothetical protein
VFCQTNTEYRFQIPIAAWMIVKIGVLLVRLSPCNGKIASPKRSTECKNEIHEAVRKMINQCVFRERYGNTNRYDVVNRKIY